MATMAMVACPHTPQPQATATGATGNTPWGAEHGPTLELLGASWDAGMLGWQENSEEGRTPPRTFLQVSLRRLVLIHGLA